MKYFKKIEEKRIYLSPVVKDDALLFAKWLNDEEVTAGLHTTHTITTEDSAEEMLESIIDKKKPSFEIILKEDDRAIGSIILTSVNELDRTATIGVYIGEKEYRGKGYSTIAIKLLCDKLKELGAKKIFHILPQSRKSAIKADTNNGFVIKKL